jgi:hypothetical protein
VKIYVVTQGIYSDYHIITATTDEALANKIAKKYSADILDEDERAQVEVFENAEETLLPYWVVEFAGNGDVQKIVNTKPYSGAKSEIYIRKDLTAIAHVFAESTEAAIKIAAEARAMALVQEGWL